MNILVLRKRLDTLQSDIKLLHSEIESITEDLRNNELQVEDCPVSFKLPITPEELVAGNWFIHLPKIDDYHALTSRSLRVSPYSFWKCDNSFSFRFAYFDNGIVRLTLTTPPDTCKEVELVDGNYYWK